MYTFYPFKLVSEERKCSMKRSKMSLNPPKSFRKCTWLHLLTQAFSLATPIVESVRNSLWEVGGEICYQKVIGWSLANSIPLFCRINFGRSHAINTCTDWPKVKQVQNRLGIKEVHISWYKGWGWQALSSLKKKKNYLWLSLGLVLLWFFIVAQIGSYSPVSRQGL